MRETNPSEPDHTTGARRAGTAALTCLLMLASAPPAEAVINPLRSRETTANVIQKVALRMAFNRYKRCGEKIEKGQLPWTLDCHEDPVALGGTGTGDTLLDATLTNDYNKGIKRYLQLRKKGDPFSHGLFDLCSPGSNVWTDIDQCLQTLILDHGRVLFQAHFDATERTVSTKERLCRSRLAREIRNLYRKILQQRARYFRHSGLLGNGAFSELFDCRAPAVPPGLGTPTSGYVSLDVNVMKAFIALRRPVYRGCPNNLEAIAFPGSFTDYTGGVFGRADLVQVYLELVRTQTDKVMDLLYVGVKHCGDGNLDADIGEECDDGNLVSCDGCDSNCTLPACGNAVGCSATGEECDDGNSETLDGCTPACVMEYCGDGTVQLVLGERCDDGDGEACGACDFDCDGDGIGAAVCGDGIVCGGIYGEQCDDGNTTGGDGCDASCQTE